jgi:hypothetical protein
MHGSIENFNGWFEEKFWAKETFTNLEDTRAKSTHFVGQYNDLSAWKNPKMVRDVMTLSKHKKMMRLGASICIPNIPYLYM